MLYTEWEINNIHHQTAFVNNNQIPHLPLDTFDAILDWKANYLQSKYACARGHSGVHCRSEANARDHSRVLALLNAPQVCAGYLWAFVYTSPMKLKSGTCSISKDRLIRASCITSWMVTEWWLNCCWMFLRKLYFSRISVTIQGLFIWLNDRLIEHISGTCHLRTATVPHPRRRFGSWAATFWEFLTGISGVIYNMEL